MPLKANKAWTVQPRTVIDLAACGELMHFTSFFDDKRKALMDAGRGNINRNDSEAEEEVSPKRRPTSAGSVISATTATIDDAVKYADRFGYTALHAAAVHGHFAICKLLLENAADVNARTDSGVTALHGAAEYGHLRIVKLLLQHGAVTDAYTTKYELALTLAADAKHSEVVVELDPLVREQTTSTDGLVAAATGDLLYFLLQQRDGPEALKRALQQTTEAGDTPMHVVTKVGRPEAQHYDVARYLASQAQLDLDAKNSQNMTALMCAARTEDMELVLMLLRSGADPTISSSANEVRTALTYTTDDALRLLLDEATKKHAFTTAYARRNHVLFADRQEYVAEVQELRRVWREAAKAHREYAASAHVSVPDFSPMPTA